MRRNGTVYRVIGEVQQESRPWTTVTGRLRRCAYPIPPFFFFGFFSALRGLAPESCRRLIATHRNSSLPRWQPPFLASALGRTNQQRGVASGARASALGRPPPFSRPTVGSTGHRPPPERERGEFACHPTAGRSRPHVTPAQPAISNPHSTHEQRSLGPRSWQYCRSCDWGQGARLRWLGREWGTLGENMLPPPPQTPFPPGLLTCCDS